MNNSFNPFVFLQLLACFPNLVQSHVANSVLATAWAKLSSAVNGPCQSTTVAASVVSLTIFVKLF